MSSSIETLVRSSGRLGQLLREPAARQRVEIGGQRVDAQLRLHRALDRVRRLELDLDLQLAAREVELVDGRQDVLALVHDALDLARRGDAVAVEDQTREIPFG